ncbi:hypothetical protein BUALT_Bualt12G0095600 [Buddleja alternifolia]|uniref:RanBP2-type domain-containing protein n=1 Tax=Buddleja alternifolia TaxID=168488 RepID=A0AAV6WNX5_9LAMI|nr:hypothetical protein BUALT_Bualt12G0095600 [Buddleja alternifolia]
MSCRQGDWMCGACQHVNFQKRDSCQRCSCPRYATPGDVSAYANALMQKTQVLAGDWYCVALNCGAHNYASRNSCYRCGASKDIYDCAAYGAAAAAQVYGYDAVPGWKTGDWICSRLDCGIHNYASRTECFKCKTPRDFGGAM